MKKLFLCLLAITAAISTAWAQTPKKNIFGLRVGMDMSKISILDTGSGEKYLSELRTSFNIGLTDQIRLLNDKPFYIPVRPDAAQQGRKSPSYRRRLGH